MKINRVCDELLRAKKICKINIYAIICINVITSACIAADSIKVMEEVLKERV